MTEGLVVLVAWGELAALLGVFAWLVLRRRRPSAEGRTGAGTGRRPGKAARS